MHLCTGTNYSGRTVSVLPAGTVSWVMHLCMGTNYSGRTMSVLPAGTVSWVVRLCTGTNYSGRTMSVLPAGTVSWVMHLCTGTNYSGRTMSVLPAGTVSWVMHLCTGTNYSGRTMSVLPAGTVSWVVRLCTGTNYSGRTVSVLPAGTVSWTKCCRGLRSSYGSNGVVIVIKVVVTLPWGIMKAGWCLTAMAIIFSSGTPKLARRRRAGSNRVPRVTINVRGCLIGVPLSPVYKRPKLNDHHVVCLVIYRRI
ncbi:unnamed protein product [Trypanosoma congolense IL3000]|uniref:WGS project CAEQ00000000 data, annotated contig 2351 n=1 Tax=Trypanosoma congolense (strain IL3000) TaxID=1068625 RepID=F9WDC2_TRYCI|nr:unnamed protein product [Trypanosoma congolense IL3000]